MVAAQAGSLVGTWSTKSQKVMTGPDKFTEPELTGISYSFTADGHFEEAYYRAISNPVSPDCPSGIMQFQHGTYTVESNGSIILNPIQVDGRQLLSSPCTYDESIFTRYHQPEVYSVYKDTFHNIQRLDLFKFDGSPMNPMFLAYSPPQMLPTQTLNPTNTASGAAASSTGSNKFRVKRDTDPGPRILPPVLTSPPQPENYDRLWWLGLGMIGLGTMLYGWSK
ncbi:MAG: hypothetical protein Q9227_007840 [Pyrenula ochraceoflavens]